MIKKTGLIIITISFVFISCSTLPGKEDDRSLVIKNRAAEYQKNGIAHYNAGRYTLALDLFELAYQLNASIDNQDGMILTHNSIGRTKLAEFKNEEALEYFKSGLVIAERINEKKLILLTKGNIGDYYIKIDDLDSAFSLLNTEMESMKSVKDEESANLAHLFSLILRKQKKYIEALEYLNKSLNFNLKNKFYRPLAADYYMLASIFSLQEKYSEALLYAEEALKYDKMIEYSQGIATDLEALAIISEKNGNLEDAEIYNKRAEIVLEAIGNINQIEKEQSDLDNNQSQ